jgi:subtilisin family serine protease
MQTNRSSFFAPPLAGVLLSVAIGSIAAPRAFSPLQHAALSLKRPELSDPVINADGRADTIIILKGDPAAVTYSKALGLGGGRGAIAQTAANNAARAAISTMGDAQEKLATALRGLKVEYTEIYRVQRVINGIAVRMKPADIDKVRALPNVSHVEFLPHYRRPTNIASVPFINAPQVWQGANSGGLGLPFNATGKGVKIGDIDTGLDFIHPDFGGSGLLADYQDINPRSTIGKISGKVLFPTAKVVGGIDLAGDAYDAINVTIPTPDPNPMDCGGHGSHTAGTLAGVGVNDDGTPYTGAYNSVAPYTNNLRIGPGVAPEADLYAIRIFGCGGGTALVTEAIEWATDPNGDGDLSDHLDVINMSLVSDFGVDVGNPFNPDVEAIRNAALLGLISVSAAGNSGDTFFINGSPAAADVGISAAATVDDGQLAGQLHVTTPTPATFAADLAVYTNANLIPPPNPSGQSGNIVLVNDGSANPTLGCDTTFQNASAVRGNIALIDRGTCSFIQKAQNAQANGAIALIVADNSGGDSILAMGGADADPAIVIPGISVSTNTGNALKAAIAPSGTELTIAQPELANTIASFSARGPVTDINGAIEIKPDIAAPGLNIPSAQTGFTCDGASTFGCLTQNASGFIPGGRVLTISGTSMATPHIAGLMALLRQLHPDASVEDLKAMAINGAAHDVSNGNNGAPPLHGASRVGAGRIDAAASVTSQLLAYNADKPGTVAVTFDIEPVGTTQATHRVTLENLTGTAQTVTLFIDTILDAPGINYSVPNSVSIPANGIASFTVSLTANTSQMVRYIDPTMAKTQTSAAFAAPGSTIAFPRQYLAERSALIKVLDASSKELARVPVYAAVRPHSTMAAADDLGASAPMVGTTALTLVGQDVCTGTVSLGSCSVSASSAALSVGEESFVSPFELQFTGSRDDALPPFANVHYVGVNSQPDKATNDYFFGIATYGRWGTPNDAIFNVCVDSDNDGLFDKVIADIDLGTIDQLFLGAMSNSPQDTFVSFVYDNQGVTTNTSFFPNFFEASQADAALLSNNAIILPAAGVDLGLAQGVTKIHYGLAVCPRGNPLCGASGWQFPGQGTSHCGGDFPLASFDGPFTYDAATPGVDGTGKAMLEDITGATLAVNYNVHNLVGNGSTGMLLLHSHNTAATSAQVVVLDRVFGNNFGN